ncbi:MAG: alpha-N-acetylglucosaminidase TIM-barrel domain-containing protein [Nakamurella sp.]
MRLNNRVPSWIAATTASALLVALAVAQPAVASPVSGAAGTSAAASAGPPAGKPAHTASAAAKTVSTSPAATAARRQLAAADAVVKRTVGAAAAQIHLTLKAGTAESFRISGKTGNIAVTASTTSAALMGVGWYLKYVAHADVGLGTAAPNLLRKLPAPDGPITQTAQTSNRYVFNDTNDGYSDPDLDWAGWQKQLDMLALHGINEVYVTPGTEAVYEQLMQKYGYSAADVRAWIPQPAHQPWWLLQNMSSQSAQMSQSQIDARAALGRKIANRARDLGIVPVLPGFFGTVPADFQTRNPGSNVVPQGTWEGYQRPGWLDPTNAIFDSVAADYYKIADKVLGASTMYKMDPLHEGGTAGAVKVPAAAGFIESALQKAHPSATWVILGWQSNPSAAVLSGIRDKSHLLIVDGLSDRYATWRPDTKWPAAPYTFGSIYDFGGHTTVGANMQVWLDRYFGEIGSRGSNLSGIAIMPEGFYNNPAAFELLAELPWHTTTFSLSGWLRNYAQGRYGTASAAAAWTTMAATAYSEPADGWSEPADSLFGAQPSLTASTAATWSPTEQRYDTAAFETALPQLISAAGSATQKAAYNYDLTDVTQQVISNRARVLLPQINAAYQAKDTDKFTALTADWMKLIKLLDTVVGTNSNFLLGTRLANITKVATTPADAQNLQYDLLQLYTVWGSRIGFNSGLGDYANREWQGLVGDYYAGRWQSYFDTLTTALKTGAQPATIDWYSYGDDWAKAPHQFPTKPTGNILKVAKSVVKTLAADPNSVTTAVSSSGSLVSSGAPVTVTLTATNSNGLSGAVSGETAQLSAPAGLIISPTGPTALGPIEPGQHATATWTISLDPIGGLTSVLAPLTISLTSTSGTQTSTLSVLAGSAPTAPWVTAHSTDAAFTQAGDTLGIIASGADMWGTTLQYGTSYQKAAVTDGTSVTVHVDSESSAGGRPWARAGIVVAADLSKAQSPGLIDLAVTPGNGCVLSWGTGTTGSLSTFLQDKSFAAPVWMKLTRTGNSYVGQCSTDGTTWTTIGTATPGGTGTTADAGLFASAANSGGTDRLTATFSHWQLAGQ